MSLLASITFLIVARDPAASLEQAPTSATSGTKMRKLDGGELDEYHPPFRKFYILSITLKGKQVRKLDHKGEARSFRSPKGRGKRGKKTDDSSSTSMSVAP